MDRANVDTDQIIPKQFLKRIERTGFGQFLFYDWRFEDDGTTPNPTFELNQPQVKNASILIARQNFGSGSSREHAVWALDDYGFRTVIAPSFADIFFNNCFKNGILPIKVTAEERDALMADASDTENPELTINLVDQTIARPNGVCISFDVDPFRKQCLLDGLDDIGLTLEKKPAIADYEAKRASDMPWL